MRQHAYLHRLHIVCPETPLRLAQTAESSGSTVARPSTVRPGAMMMAAGHGGPGVESDGRGVYVGGLPKHAEWQELKDHMKRPGTRTLGLSMVVPTIGGYKGDSQTIQFRTRNLINKFEVCRPFFKHTNNIPIITNMSIIFQ